MTTLDDAERLLDAALTRLEGASARLSGWREAEAAAERRADEAEAEANRRAGEAEAEAGRRIAAAEAEAARRIGEAEAGSAAAIAERDAATGELQGLRDRCETLDRELAEHRAAAAGAAEQAAQRLAGLERRLAESSAAQQRLEVELRQMEESATREVERLDGLCRQLDGELAVARAMAERLDRAARAAAGALQDALGPGAGDV
ncbi:MAG TPA: hypothetical protein PKA13_16370 [Geminicoccaceae bacterium]|nr:hypothetical protein [Geminicoccus sp.]HMU51351.1 hypothetical protein [Geminicoccaceae bacterium]